MTTPPHTATARRVAPPDPNRNSPETLCGIFQRLAPSLRRAVSRAGYITPTPVQEECIPHLLDGRDLIGTARTGTGKTAAFVLPLLQRLNATACRPRRGLPRALILAPTRELAAQIDASIQVYGRFLDVRHAAVFGGVSQFHQVKALNRGLDILVATPGRLLDLNRQGEVRFDRIEVFVLDEVDRMLDMGFLPDIERVLEQLPAERQTLFFSATLPPKMAELAATMVRDPVRVAIEPDQPAVERIAQKVLFVGKKDKDALLVSLLNGAAVDKVLVFTQMKHAASRVADKLRAAGIQGEAIHGNKTQAARTRALDGFKRGRFRVLVATDVASRGIDVDDITHVINYDLPMEAETYVHRIGRTGRAGADGDAISFCTAEDRAYLRRIERLLGTTVPTDVAHPYHSEEAFHSTAPAPGNFGRTATSKGRRPATAKGAGRRPSKRGNAPRGTEARSRPRRPKGL